MEILADFFEPVLGHHCFYSPIFQEWIGRPVVCNSRQNCNSHHDANAEVSFKFGLRNITPLLKSTLVFGQFLPRDSVRLGYHQVNRVFSKKQCEEEQSFWSVWDFYFNPRESCIECFDIKIFEDFTPLAFFFDKVDMVCLSPVGYGV